MPLTSSVICGAVVPMPTLPVLVITKSFPPLLWIRKGLPLMSARIAISAVSRVFFNCITTFPAASVRSIPKRAGAALSWATCSLNPGPVVPMPTLPELSNTNTLPKPLDQNRRSPSVPAPWNVLTADIMSQLLPPAAV